MDDAIQAATQAIHRMNQQMDQDNMDIETRIRIVEFANLQRKLLRQQLTPQQQIQIDQIPYKTSTGQQNAQPANQQTAVTAQAHSRDDHGKGSMRYLRNMVALQQLAYATLWQTSDQSPASEEIQQEAVATFNNAVRPEHLTVAAEQDLEAIQDPCTKTITSYASATLPRALERNALSNLELIGISTVDSERIKKVLR
jgi:hypothetical protein